MRSASAASSRFFKDVLIEDDDRVGAKHKIAVYGRRLGTGKPEHVVDRCLALLNLLPERRPQRTSNGMPACSENLAAAWGLGSQNEHRPTW